MAGIFAINNEFVWALNHFIIAIARYVPHSEFVTLFNDFAANFHILERRSAHVGQGGLVPNDFWNHIGHQVGVSS